ncbi:hypothetical protein GCM10007425_04710 [Lysinibacillus alkalisoli]|uniref:Uncharacterized protein n=1 Tax=Lysinibacillus alkalisoli TaxID=1911548 RepID=A0A917FY35_9BACI|nr:hypothetical protein [Lysinibacillus alkalisoli]GGG13462.1 hypothetical protein GCM10007425_04710 [Lysinibacillus alkalisoli]
MKFTDTYIIGNLTFLSSWLAVLFALFFTWLIIRLQYRKETAQLYSDLAFTFIIVWKFSAIFTDFSIIVQQPLSLLYFNGGKIGIVFAFIAVCIQFWRKRMTVDAKEMAVAIMMTQSIFQLAMVILNDNHLWQEVITLVVFSSTLIYSIRTTHIKIALQNFAFIHILVALLQPVPIYAQFSVWFTIIAVGMWRLWQRSIRK